jgi:acyl-CoA synthetase (AMP-forming)/AMP-acid ligase II
MSNVRRPPSTLWHAFLSTVRSQQESGAATALISPQQKIHWSVTELERKARGLSQGLLARGVVPGHVVATDVPIVAEGLLLYLACARIGATVATAKTADVLPTLAPTCAVVSPAEDSWMAREALPAPPIVAGQDEMDSMLTIATLSEEGDALDNDTDPQACQRPLAYFNSPHNALTHGVALQ